MSCIIYLITNSINEKVYIGQTWQTLIERFDSGHGYKGCLYLNSAIKKYGKNKFNYTILSITEDQITANWLETFWITIYDSTNRNLGYNLRSGGSRGKHSNETKTKISNAHIGKIASVETKQKMSASHKGLNTWIKNSILSEKHKKKISIATSGQNNPNYGKVSVHKGKTWKLINGKRTYFNQPADPPPPPPPVQSIKEIISDISQRGQL